VPGDTEEVERIHVPQADGFEPLLDFSSAQRSG
jgi:hypothetical protein